MDAQLLENLCRNLASAVVARRRVAGREARFGEWPAALSPAVTAAASTLGLSRPWAHQARGLEAALGGRDVVLTSPTASGKSLVYVAAAFHRLLAGPDARVLYLAPTKALAHDQLARLERWNEAFPPADRIAIHTYDGDTPRSARADVRRRARWVLTNPEMLHVGILPHHARWGPFLAGLELVVLDELHLYRGVFGSHVANVLRRLARLVRFHGGAARPPLRYVACSATIANPASLAHRLTGAPPEVVSASGAPTGERHYLFCEPPLENAALSIRRPFGPAVEEVVAELARTGTQTLVFVQTRRAAEQLVRGLRERLADDVPRDAVRAYRGGYRPDERRAVEQELRSGELRVVVSTNALELGVDVGLLEACVLAGYPGSVASVLQQTGRAGRRGESSLAVLMARPGAIDRFVVRHPELVLGEPTEHAQLDPDNPLVLLQHLRCAAAELPLEAGETLGEPTSSADLTETLCEALAFRGEVVTRSGRTHWIGTESPAPEIGLRSLETAPVRLLCRADPEPAPARLLGTIDRTAALSEAHPGAVYLHDGDAYRVEEVDWEDGRALVVPTGGEIVTRPLQELSLAPVRVRERREVTGGEVCHGDLELELSTVGYREIDAVTGELLEEHELELPPRISAVSGYWLTLSEDAVTALRAGGWWRTDPVGYRGPNWQAQRRRARERDGHRCTHCGAPEAQRQHDIHHLRPFREFGYVRGTNRAYREANQLDNLVTLCRSCHARAENGQRLEGAVERLCTLLGNVAPLLLMCDPRDLSVRLWRPEVEDPEALEEPAPALALLERTPAGVGFGEACFRLHEALLERAWQLASFCDCTGGCPACVGPPGEGERDGRDFALAILAALGAGGAR